MFLAIERHRTNRAYDRHYVVKVENHDTMRARCEQNYRQPNMTAIPDEDDDVHFIPLEALILLLTKASPRFPDIDSVYVDAAVHSIVMGACIDHDVLTIRDLTLEGRIPPVFSGKYLNNNKRPVVNELEACKIASQLLEGFTYLWDMDITHSDLSYNNFLIDEQLNVSPLPSSSLLGKEKGTRCLTKVNIGPNHRLRNDEFRRVIILRPNGVLVPGGHDRAHDNA